jgi:hypothetical protein
LIARRAGAAARLLYCAATAYCFPCFAREGEPLVGSLRGATSFN